MTLVTGRNRLAGVVGSWAVVAIALPAHATAQEKQPFTTEDALNVVSLNVQAITKDGRYVAATRATQRDRKNVDHMRFGDPT